MLNNQNYLQDLGLLEELDEQSAETINGGYEVFTIRNKTGYNINFFLDNTSFTQSPNDANVYTASSGGIIEFDTDGRNDYKQFQKYDLANGGVYEFQDNKNTPGNPYDIDLYSVA
ncbi:hypothetical protein [Nostoc sp.]|uniref:hypothetical protein n=1 Tax=Nostoc sp. TaxID=1180 RepID=UPI002FFC253A